MKKELKVGNYTASIEILFELPYEQRTTAFNVDTTPKNIIGIKTTFCEIDCGTLWYEFKNNQGNALVIREIDKQEEKLRLRLEEADRLGGDTKLLLLERGYK